MEQHSGIILKKLSYSEADEIITVLFKGIGIKRLFVRGSRKSKKRFGGLIDHFAHLKFFFSSHNKGLSSLTSVEEFHESMQRDLWTLGPNFAYASLLSEFICEFTPEDGDDHGLYDLWLSLYNELKQKELTPDMATNYFIMFLRHVGYAPDFIEHFQEGHSQAVVDNEWMSLLTDLVSFAEKIMQKPSRAAPFFLSTLDPENGAGDRR
ncbi:MAG: DNA repair protein RecO [bacterium]|nr:DNA repair protein RecO [bacterium]MBU1916803.1 DNA repair protein RecO [bacterium]